MVRFPVGDRPQPFHLFRQGLLILLVVNPQPGLLPLMLESGGWGTDRSIDVRGTALLPPHVPWPGPGLGLHLRPRSLLWTRIKPETVPRAQALTLSTGRTAPCFWRRRSCCLRDTWTPPGPRTQWTRGVSARAHSARPRSVCSHVESEQRLSPRRARGHQDRPVTLAAGPAAARTTPGPAPSPLPRKPLHSPDKALLGCS